MSKEVLDKLSILEEGPGYHIVMFDGDQIALEDSPGETMIFDITDEALIENAEMDQDKVDLIRDNYDLIKNFIETKGYKVVCSDDFYE